MWKILQSLQRAFRQHVHSPRPSAGLYVEEEQDVAAEKSEKLCPFSWIRRNSKECLDKPTCSARVLDSLHIEGQENDFAEGCRCGSNANYQKKKWWRTSHRDFWHYMPHTNYMIEAISWGSAVLCGTDSDRLRRKTRLLYRVLCTVPGSKGTQKNVVDNLFPGSVAPKSPSLLAIKDAEGSAHDLAVNVSKSETLDSAMEEFQSMCNEYTARNEIMLGLEAWEKGDMSTAVKHLRSSCLLGNSTACFNLGLCYEKGSGVEPDPDKAERYYKLAAKGGNSMALFNLGLLYMNHVQEEDETGAAVHCGCKKNEAINLMERAARLGLAEAQTYLGMYHIDEKRDLPTAVQYFRAAAEQNDAEAQYFLASCYEHGWGVTMNECRAAQLYSLAASAGHVTALYNLAEFNEHGLGGLPVDRSSALELYQKAADLGSEEAKMRLKEINLETKEVELSEKQKGFGQHYIHTQSDVLSSHSSALSPSLSSPNLLDYLHSIPNYFSAAWESRHDHNTNTNVDKCHFHLEPLENVVTGTLAAGPMCQPQQKGLYIPREMHRSHTYPNIAMVACNN
ncbi:hypothetical protein BgiMline_021697 [Biomphalaria glabrata]|uniref:Uncharacterized protein LOC106057315 n=1 Tax=Biomphalaria glabrata TaxID=6526 RepID=A0A9U8E2D8_BIOGL|nr:uncharacterized protein LOC106057315 [Biomphalaria glabrata]KAI8734057.1 hypothetical protein BgiMline_028284 [Biomphalaria glabrata]